MDRWKQDENASVDQCGRSYVFFEIKGTSENALVWLRLEKAKLH